MEVYTLIFPSLGVWDRRITNLKAAWIIQHCLVSQKFKMYNARANIIQILSLYEKDWKKSIRALKGLGPGWKDELALLVFIKNRVFVCILFAISIAVGMLLCMSVPRRKFYGAVSSSPSTSVWMLGTQVSRLAWLASGPADPSCQTLLEHFKAGEQCHNIYKILCVVWKVNGD